METATLYVSESCRVCDGAATLLKRLARTWGFGYTVVSTDQTPCPSVPAVPAVAFRGVLYVGARWPQRLRLALSDPAALQVGAA